MRILIMLPLLLAMSQAISQQPCNTVPSEKELLVAMSAKPVTDITRMDFQKDCNVTDTVKKRLLYLLKNEWSKQELDAYFRKDLEEHKRIYQIDERIKEATNGVDSLKAHARDSIINAINSDTKERLSEGSAFGVSASIVLTVGYLELKETVPFLKSVISDSAHYNQWAIELALARMGDKKLQGKIINNSNYNPSLEEEDWKNDYYENARSLFYIGSQESIFKLTDWLDTSKMYTALSEGGKDSKNAFITLVDLKYAIKNKEFQAILQGIEVPMGQKDDKLILKAKEWLINNRKHYQIDRTFSPY